MARACTATSSRSRLSGSSPAVAARGDEARALGALWSQSTKLQLRLCRGIGVGFANAPHVFRSSVLCCAVLYVCRTVRTRELLALQVDGSKIVPVVACTKLPRADWLVIGK